MAAEQHDATNIFAVKKAKVGGEFVRPDSKLREAITADGRSGLKAEPSRFHLYIANNCPWQVSQSHIWSQDVAVTSHRSE